MIDESVAPAAESDAPGPDPETAPRPRGRLVHIQRRLRRFGTAAALFIVVTAVFGTVFALITPAFWGHDEITQFGRAYQVAHGGELPQRIPDSRGVSYGGEVPASISDLMGYALHDYENNAKEPAPMVADPGGYDRLEQRPVSSNDATVWFTNTAAYSPIPYLTDAAAIRVAEAVGADTGGVLLAARFAGLVTYLALGALALRALRGRRIAWLVFALALLPIAVFQAGTVTADTMTNGMAVLFSALFIKAVFLRDRLSRPQTLALLGSVLALPLCKPTYFLLAMLVAIVPRDRLSGPFARRWVPQISAVIALALFAVWTKLSSGTGAGMGLMRPPNQWHSVVPGEQLSGILHDPLHFLNVFYRTLNLRDNLYFREFFGQLGFAYIPVPATTIVCALLALVLAFGIAEHLHPRRWSTTITTVVVLLGVGMIFGTLYLGFSPVGYYIIDGVQGRYFLPLAFVGFAVLLRWVPLRVTSRSSRSGSSHTAVRGPVIAIVVLTVLSLLFAVLKYATVVW